MVLAGRTLTPAEQDACLLDTDAAALCGLDPERSALDVYTSLAYGVPRRPSKIAPVVEPIRVMLLDEYRRRTGLGFERMACCLSPDAHERLAVSVDAISADALVEAYAAPGDARAEWGADTASSLPPWVAARCAFASAVMGGMAVHVIVLAGWDMTIHLYRVEPDKDAGQRMLELAAAFLQQVDAKQAPPPGWNGDATRWLQARFPAVEEGRLIQDDSDAVFEDLEQYRAAEDHLKQAKKLHEASSASIKIRIGDHVGIRHDKLGIVEWEPPAKGQPRKLRARWFASDKESHGRKPT